MTGLFLFNFETTQRKNRFDTNLVKIHSVIVIFMFYATFFQDGRRLPVRQTTAILEYKIAKYQNGFIQEIFWHKIGSILTKGSSDIVVFTLMLVLVTASGGDLG